MSGLEDMSILQLVLQTTIVGMGVVFNALLFLYIYIEVFRRLMGGEAPASVPVAQSSTSQVPSANAEPEFSPTDEDALTAAAVAVSIAIARHQHVAPPKTASHGAEHPWRLIGRADSMIGRRVRR